MNKMLPYNTYYVVMVDMHSFAANTDTVSGRIVEVNATSLHRAIFVAVAEFQTWSSGDWVAVSATRSGHREPIDSLSRSCFIRPDGKIAELYVHRTKPDQDSYPATNMTVQSKTPAGDDLMRLAIVAERDTAETNRMMGTRLEVDMVCPNPHNGAVGRKIERPTWPYYVRLADFGLPIPGQV